MKRTFFQKITSTLAMSGGIDKHEPDDRFNFQSYFKFTAFVK